MNRNYQVGWWIIVLTIVMMFVPSFSLDGADTALNSVISEYFELMLGELLFLVPIGAGILYLKATKQYDKDALALGRTSPVVIVLAVLAVMGAQYFITYATLPIQAILIIIFGAETATSMMSVPANVGEFVAAFITLCIVAPVIEELLCRGVLIKIFERYGAAIAVFSTSFAFAILHFEARSIIQLFFVGVLLGVFRVYSGSIIPCIVMHSANNFLSLCQMTFFFEGEQIALGICVLLAVLFVPVMYITFVKCSGYFKTDIAVRTNNSPGISVGFFVCLAVFVLYNFTVILERLINL